MKKEEYVKYLTSFLHIISFQKCKFLLLVLTSPWSFFFFPDNTILLKIKIQTQYRFELGEVLWVGAA